jgi:outer membrane protein assembly factor BamA
MFRFFLFLIFFLYSLALIQAQESSFFYVEKILIEGHKKTLEKTILRELDFKVGDSITTSKMKERFAESHEMLMNSGLFNSAEINVINWDYEQKKATISIKVVEVWYVFPFGWLSLADRNFNVWWKDKNHDLKRLNFQIGLNWNNFTGRRDRLRVSSEFGFARKYEIDYQIPGINAKRTVGLFFNTLYSKNKEVWYTTEKDRLQFYRDESTPQITRFRTSVGFSFRPKLRITHSLQVAYFDNIVTPEIASNAKNPSFFLDSKTTQRYFSLNYKFAKDNRDNKFYAQKGYFLSINMQKDGLFSPKEDVQALYLTTVYAQYFKIYKDKFDLETITKVRKELTNKAQPYYNIRALGYSSDYLRGYEYYVIDGANYAYFKSSFRYNLVDKEIDYGELVPPSLRYIPFKVWICVNNDLGYVKNNTTSVTNVLPNRLLWGRGIGLNVLFYRSNYFQLEASQNYFGKVGVFLHYKTLLD